MESILNTEKGECFWCKYLGQNCIKNTELHHIFFGKNRKIADREGLTVNLCLEHHKGTSGVHGMDGDRLNYTLKEIAQETWEQKYIENHPGEGAQEKAREAFIRMMGKNYL